MKRLLLLLLLIAFSGLLSLDAFAGDDDSKYQYFIACGEVHREDASKTPEEILELIDKLEAACDQTDDQNQETPLED